MGEKKTCVEEIWNGALWSRFRCTNNAKYGDYCGIHSPEKQEERRKKRGPTQWELDMAAKKAERERITRLESSHAELLEALKFLMVGDLAVGHTAYDKARQALKRAEEEK